MRLLISLVLLIALSPYAVALNSLDRAELSHINSLQDVNPGFESGTVKWSGSGGTFTINSTPADQFVAGSKQFAVWDSDGAAQERCSALVKVPQSGNCSVGLEYRVPSGTATHKIVAKDGSKDLAIEDVVSSTSAMKHEVEFPCAAAASNQARVCLRSVASNEPAIQFDSAYAGYARLVGMANAKTPWASYTPVISNLGTGSVASSFGQWRQDGDSAEIQYNWTKDGSGGSGAGLVTVGPPPGCSVDSSKLPNGASSVNGEAYSSLTTDLVQLVSSANGGAFYVKRDTAVNVTGADVTAGSNWRGSFKVPCVGWTASTVVMPDAQGWFASGFISGANPALGNTAVSTYAEIANGSLTLTANTGSAPVGIACSAANSSTVGSSTCSAGNEIIGVTANIPRSGVYEACFQFGHVINIGGSAGGSLTAAFQVVETANASGTVTKEANGRVTSGAGYEGGSNSPNQVNPVMVCGTLSLSAGQRLIKVYYEQVIPSGTIFTNEIQADASAAVGQRNVYFIVRPVNSQQQAILANSVSTQVTNGLKIESAKLTTTTGPNACAITSQFGTWLTGTPSSGGAGQCSFTIATGTFSGTPHCKFNVFSGGLAISATGNASSATAATFQIWDAVGYGTTGGVVAECIGPR